MLFKCINCFVEWGEGVDDGEYSHGLCLECTKSILSKRIHTEQINYSGNPCFGSNCDCENIICKYHELCTEK